MIKIRLTRGGKRNSPFYRIVAIESTKKRGGKPLEILGFWDPKSNEFKLDKKMFDDLVAKGAQPSDKIRSLMTNPPKVSKK